MVLQTVVTLVNLTGRRLTAEGEKDLEQARQGIEAVRALLPLCPQEELGPVKDAVSQLQMIYVRETGGGGGEAPAPGAEPQQPGEPAAARSAEAGRAIADLDASGQLVGVFGGSGFYRFLDDVEEVALDTPYGPPSARIRIGEVEGRRVAFMPRHGDDHQLPAHRINYRANVWAMREVGVRRLIGPFACGSLTKRLPPGSFVVVTSSSTAPRAARTPSTTAHRPPMSRPPTRTAPISGTCWPRRGTRCSGGTVVVIQGPRFSTRAESRWFSEAGFDLVNMTQYPEAWLARELELCYAGLGLVTDYDVGLDGVRGGDRRTGVRCVRRQPR